MYTQLRTTILYSAFDTLLNFGNVITDVFFACAFERDFGGDDGDKDPDFVSFVIDFVAGPFDFAIGNTSGDTALLMDKNMSNFVCVRRNEHTILVRTLHLLQIIVEYDWQI